MSVSSPPASSPDVLSPATSRHGGGLSVSRSPPSDQNASSTSSRRASSSPIAMRGGPGVPLSAGGPPTGGGDPSGSGRGPTSGTASTASTTAVSDERKRALLLEARRDRLAWIEEVSSPFRHDTGGGGGGGGNDGSNSNTDEEAIMTLLGSSRACDTMKSAYGVVAALYGTTLEDGAEGWTGGMSRTEAMERMKHQLEKNVSEADLKKIISGIGSDKTAEDESLTTKDREFADAYRKFVDNLKSPQCADLVQGMKHFVLSFRNMADALVGRSGNVGMVVVEVGENASRLNGGPKGGSDDVANKRGCSEDDIRELASAVHGYVGKTLDIIRTHPLWMKRDGDGAAESLENDDGALDITKQVLESFVFAKCRGAIWAVIASCKTATDLRNQDEMMDDKLAALQFVTPSHLDIHHLLEGKNDGGTSASGGDGDGEGGVLQPWDIALEASISSLRSINRQHSPGMMLSCILGAYKGVNDALSNAMVKDAGADDVLPTLILSVLRAKPARIASALKFIDLFATHQQMRGEAGYAYTNLYGAVQFIQDLDFEEHSSSEDHANGVDGSDLKAKRLTITPEEFRRGLEKCTLEAKKNGRNGESTAGDGRERQSESAKDAEEEDDDEIFDIPASVVREARLRGEVVDVDWAHKWLGGRRAEARKERAIRAESEVFDEDERKSLPKPPPLPQGFTRSYTFLSTKPEDIRVCDIPQLLQEYRMLVHASEALLAERTAKYNAEHKMHTRRMRDRLRESAGAAAQL